MCPRPMAVAAIRNSSDGGHQNPGANHHQGSGKAILNIKLSQFCGILKGMKEITEGLAQVFRETAATLRGSERRLFMARIVEQLGRGGQRYAEKELRWNRGTIRKGLRELKSGIVCVDNFKGRGRKRAEAHLPNLLIDIAAIVDGQSQTDATFRTTQLYTRLSAQEVRSQLIAQKGYTEVELPCATTIGNKLNELGSQLRPVVKSKPQKKLRRQMPSLPS